VEMHQEKPENQTSSFSEGTPNLDHEQENCVRNDSNPAVLSVKVLGPGCARCKALEANTKSALDKLGLKADFNHVTDFSQIAAYGIMSTPALVINEKVVSFGRVLSAEEVVKILRSELQL